MNSLHILSGGAAEGLVARTAPDFTAHTAYSVGGAFGAVGVMADRLRKGEEADILILTRALISQLSAEGLVRGESTVDVGAVPTSLAVRVGEGIPHADTQEDLRAILLAASGIFVPDTETSTAGRHVAWMLRELGIWEEAQPLLRVFPNGATAMAALAKSNITGGIGCTQATEILNTPGITRIADLPEGVALSTVYTAAISTRSGHAEAAADLIAALAASPARGELGFVV